MSCTRGMKIYASQSGMAEMLIAAAIVTGLAVMSFTTGMSSRIADSKKIERINRLEAFYSGELAAWNAYLRTIDGMGPGASGVTIVLDNEPFRDIASSLPAENYSASPGYALSVRTTQQSAPIALLVRRHNAANFQAVSPNASTHCGKLKFSASGKKYRVCLFKAPPSPPPKKGMTIATNYNLTAVIIGGKIYAWGVPEGNYPLGVHLVDTSELPANTKWAQIGGNGICPADWQCRFGFNAITEGQELVAIACLGGTNNNDCQWKARKVEIRDSTGTLLKIADQQGSMYIDSRGRLLDRRHYTPEGSPIGEIPEAMGLQWKALSVVQAGDHCALAENGQVFCYDLDGQGHSSVGTLDGFRALDLSQLLPNEKVIQLSASTSTQCLLTDLGNGYCFGIGGSSGGQQNQANFKDLTHPSRRLNMDNAVGSKKIVWLSAPTPGLAITEDGIGYMWGEWCGSGVVDPAPIYSSTLPQPFRWKMLLAGEANSFACGFSEANDYYCLGSNQFHQFGDETSTERVSCLPHPVKKIW